MLSHAAAAKTSEVSKQMAKILDAHGFSEEAAVVRKRETVGDPRPSPQPVLAEFVAEEYLSVEESRDTLDEREQLEREWISICPHGAAAETGKVSKRKAKILDAHGFSEEAAVVRKRETVGDPRPSPQPVLAEFVAEEYLSVEESRDTLDEREQLEREWISICPHGAAAETGKVSKRKAKILDAHGFTEGATVVRKHETVGDPRPSPQPVLAEFVAEEYLSVEESRDTLDEREQLEREWISICPHGAAAETGKVSKRKAKILDAHGFTEGATVVRKHETVGDPRPSPHPAFEAMSLQPDIDTSKRDISGKNIVFNTWTTLHLYG
jgi:hypothetical protein